MPCRSDYMEQTGIEKRFQETCQLLIYVKEQLGLEVSDKLRESADTMYCKDDRVAELCDVITKLDAGDREELIYGNPKDKTARKLADWWEEHEAADRARREKEAKEARKKKLKKSAWKKLKKALTEEEIKALGLK